MYVSAIKSLILALETNIKKINKNKHHRIHKISWTIVKDIFDFRALRK